MDNSNNNQNNENTDNKSIEAKSLAENPQINQINTQYNSTHQPNHYQEQNLQFPNATNQVIQSTDPIQTPLNPGTINNNYSTASTLPMLSNQKKSKKKLILIISGLVLALGGLAGYYFLLYLPNLPENVWKSGLSNTSNLLSSVTSNLSANQVSSKFEKSQINIDGEIKNGKNTYKITSDIKYQNFDSNANVAYSSSGDNKIYIKADIKTISNPTYFLPDIYFKLKGISALSDNEIFGLGSVLTEFNKYEDKWIFINGQDFSDAGINTEKNDQSSINQDDVIKLSKELQLVTSKYLFASEGENAIFNNVRFINTEKSDDSNANHYKVKMDKSNLIKFCNAIGDVYVKSDFFKHAQNKKEIDIDQEKNNFEQYCKDLFYEFDSAQDYDIWINKDFKIFNKLRLYRDLDKLNADNEKPYNDCIQRQTTSYPSACTFYKTEKITGQQYIEVGQRFIDRDTIVLYWSYVDETNNTKSKSLVELIFNYKKYDISAKFTASDKTDSENETDANIQVKLNSYDGSIDKSRPMDAIPVQKIFETTN